MPPETDTAEIFRRADERRAKLALSYTGAVEPSEAWALLSQSQAVLVDVRSEAEYRFVGHVPQTPNLPWRGNDAESVRAFLASLREIAPPDRPVLFLCRSGARSHSAATAAVQSGYGQAYNILEGFEGQKDGNQQRGRVDGWRKHGLPWEQD